MKYIAMFMFAIAALAMGACAHHDEARTQTYESTTTTSGYSK